MKLLRVIPTMDPEWGGPCQGIRNSTPATARLGVQSEVMCVDPAGAEWAKTDSFPVHNLGPRRYGYSYSPGVHSWLSANIGRFDAIVIDSLWQWTGPATLLALRRQRRNGSGNPSPALFVMPHGGLDPWYQRDRSRRLKAIRNTVYWWLAERFVINTADGLLFTALDEITLARTAFSGYSPRRELCVGYGTPPAPRQTLATEQAARMALPNLYDARPYLLYLGRVHPKKGVDWLVEAYGKAMRQCEEPRKMPALVIAGPGADSSFGRRVQRLAQECGVADSVFFPGMLHGDAKWGVLYGCQAFVICSHQENFGIAIVEALSCDKPVLITDKVNIWREIEADRGGLVAQQDRAAFSSLLQKWLSLGADGKSQLTPRACYEKNFTIERHAELFASTLRKVIAEKKRTTNL